MIAVIHPPSASMRSVLSERVSLPYASSWGEITHPHPQTFPFSSMTKGENWLWCVFMWVSSLSASVNPETSVCHTQTSFCYRWYIRKCVLFFCFFFKYFLFTNAFLKAIILAAVREILVLRSSLSESPPHTPFCFSCIAAVTFLNRSCGKTDTVYTSHHNRTGCQTTKWTTQQQRFVPGTEPKVYETKGLGHDFVAMTTPLILFAMISKPETYKKHRYCYAVHRYMWLPQGFGSGSLVLSSLMYNQIAAKWGLVMSHLWMNRLFESTLLDELWEPTLWAVQIRCRDAYDICQCGFIMHYLPKLNQLIKKNVMPCKVIYMNSTRFKTLRRTLVQFETSKGWLTV